MRIWTLINLIMSHIPEFSIPLNTICSSSRTVNDEATLHWLVGEHLTNLINRGHSIHQLSIEFVQVGDFMNTTRHLVKLEVEDLILARM
jgi:hypothetical protein